MHNKNVAKEGQLIIEENAWVGAGSVVLPNALLNKRSILEQTLLSTKKRRKMKFGTDLLQNLRKNLIDNKQVKMITKKANLIRTLKNIYFSKNEPVSLVHFLTNRCNARCSFCL